MQVRYVCPLVGKLPQFSKAGRSVEECGWQVTHVNRMHLHMELVSSHLRLFSVVQELGARAIVWSTAIEPEAVALLSKYD